MVQRQKVVGKKWLFGSIQVTESALKWGGADFLKRGQFNANADPISPAKGFKLNLFDQNCSRPQRWAAFGGVKPCSMVDWRTGSGRQRDDEQLRGEIFEAVGENGGEKFEEREEREIEKRGENSNWKENIESLTGVSYTGSLEPCNPSLNCFFSPGKQAHKQTRPHYLLVHRNKSLRLFLEWIEHKCKNAKMMNSELFLLLSCVHGYWTQRAENFATCCCNLSPWLPCTLGSAYRTQSRCSFLSYSNISAVAATWLKEHTSTHTRAHTHTGTIKYSIGVGVIIGALSISRPYSSRKAAAGAAICKLIATFYVCM